MAVGMVPLCEGTANRNVPELFFMVYPNFLGYQITHHLKLRACYHPTEYARLRKMGREEQKEEREVLDSIFPDEIQG
jgi:hypothetical protein